MSFCVSSLDGSTQNSQTVTLSHSSLSQDTHRSCVMPLKTLTPNTVIPFEDDRSRVSHSEGQEPAKGAVAKCNCPGFGRSLLHTWESARSTSSRTEVLLSNRCTRQVHCSRPAAQNKNDEHYQQKTRLEHVCIRHIVSASRRETELRSEKQSQDLHAHASLYVNSSHLFSFSFF